MGCFKNKKALLDANLDLPFILEVYNYLVATEKLPPSKLPRVKKELLELIRTYNNKKELIEELSHINFCLNYL